MWSAAQATRNAVNAFDAAFFSPSLPSTTDTEVEGG
jgi:hypothetical protein